MGLAVVAVAALAAATGRPRILEAFIALAFVLGLGLVSGALERPARRPRPVRTTADPALAAAVGERLRQLDQLEHRRVDLGDPWPTLVIGPTGVAVLAPAGPDDADVVRRLRTTAAEVDHLLAGTDASALPVRAVLVTAGTAGGATVVHDVDAEVERVSLDALLDHLARGPLTSMTCVREAHGRLAGSLAPDLRPVR